MNKKLILVVGVIVGLLVTGMVGFAADKPGEGVTVTVGRATWQSAKPVEAVTTLLMEKLGYDVKPPKSMSNPIFYQSLVLGDLDYWPNVWWPLHKPQLPENFNEKATILGNIVENGALQGFLVDKKTAEKLDIVSLTDFKRKEVIEAFDYD
ncbi:MAG: glycine betaine ABC transporter substrate-binding protein, partial [Candidatus Bipolaricaulia bacterium]